MKMLHLLLLSALILTLALLLQHALDGNGALAVSRAELPVVSYAELPVVSRLVSPDVGSQRSAPDGPAYSFAEPPAMSSAEPPVVSSAEAPVVSYAEPRSTPVGAVAAPPWNPMDAPSPSVPGEVQDSGVSSEPTPSLPRVESFEPGTNALVRDLHQPVVVVFDDRSPTATYALTISPSVKGEFTWRDEHSLVFAPDPGWAPNTRYELRLVEGWQSWFRTERVIKSVSPTQDKDVSPHASLAIQFGVEVERAAVERAFVITPTVAGDLRWTDARRLVFEPDRPLDYATTYRLGFHGQLRDAHGMPLPAVTGWSFSTRPALMSTRPKGETGVESLIQLKFDTPMDQESVEAALSVTPTIVGAFEWQGNLLTLTPDSTLEPYTTYSLTLSAAARDVGGRPVLAQDYHWHFNTSSLPHTIDFGYGPNVQVLDADGGRAIQLDSYGANQATLRLYALSVEQFLDRYTSSFRGIGPAEEKAIETRDLPLVLTWEQALERPAPVEVLIPSTVAPGLYVLEAQNGPGRDQLIVVLTRHALVVKQAERQLVTWASTMVGHAPAAGMHLRFYDRDGRLLGEGTTEGRGLHRTLLPENTEPPVVSPVEPLIVVGELDGDITVSGLGNEWQVGWSWWGWWKSSPSASDAAIYPYTDRPIYRPGQTVHARAVVRRDDDAVYSLPQGMEVVLRLRDARDNVIATRRLTADEFGAAYADFEIADGGTVGTYHLEVSALGETFRQPFLVEAYRKPDYEVSVTPAREHVVSGEPLTITVEARYFFGQPVTGAQVELLPYVVGYDDWYMGRPAFDYGFPYEKLRRGGHTDAEGRFTIVLPAEVTNGEEQQTWNVEVTVTDASELSVSGHGRVVVHRADYGLSLHTDRYHYSPGESIPVALVARDHDGSPQAGVDLTVGLYAWERQSGEYSERIVETETTTGIDGSARATLQTSRSGWYQLRAEGLDEARRQVQAQSWVWVYGAGGVLEAGSGGELRLSTDRERYAPGDAVALLVESPVSGPALLSFERGTTRRETVIQLEAGVNRIEFALLPEDAPNVHVAVAVWRPTAPGEEWWRWQSRPDQELLTAQTEILVPADDKRLAVTIMPDRTTYAPRDEAVFLVEIRDAAGSPVRAGFSLALVDEAIFALAADETPDIFDAFYQPRPDIVRTYHSLRPTRWLDWGMGGGGGGEAMGGSPRSDFPDTAFWAANLSTDAAGQAWVRVPLPDSLTSWRAVVRAVSVDTQVGQATANVTVARPLSIQPLLPRFLIQEDEAVLTAVIHNDTSARREAGVRLSVTGLEISTAPGALSATQGITLPANGTLAVGWPVVARALGQASVRMEVTLEGEGGAVWRDAVELPLEVMPRAIPQVDTVAVEVEGEWVETITLPEAAIPDASRWELALAPSIATGMLDGLEFLIDYPFG